MAIRSISETAAGVTIAAVLALVLWSTTHGIGRETAQEAVSTVVRAESGIATSWTLVRADRGEPRMPPPPPPDRKRILPAAGGAKPIEISGRL